ncbi:MAG TPA: WbuC family cupin fold metalloprotein [Steroidobacteraceae bacterium]|jgi:cupin fold WbuC family metalloprotein|nr:WbuC family cupin fold metalloprotein [Steroidobacteraceae bacterium]
MKLFADTLLDDLATQAAASPRQRAHLNVHETAADPVQRFFVVARRGSYFRPHAHLSKAELVIALRGRFEILTFDPAGHVLGRYDIGEGAGQFAYEAESGTWHTIVALSDVCAFLEVKQGPYDPAVAVDFAPWAPAEGAPSVAGFQQWLREASVGGLYSP